MEFTLDPIETRVLGALMEKDLATPEYYPMTLNALVNACNQKSSRDPVVEYEEETVEATLESLRKKGLSGVLTGAGNRVPKYSHRISEALNLGRRELALLTVMMLRGPQTLNELKTRTERMHGFTDLEEVQSVLDRLADMQPPLVVRLPLQPGTREVRYAQLLSGEVPAAPAAAARTAQPGLADRVAVLEEKVAELERQLEQFRRQFE